jgi:hypothetical protein
MGLHGLLQRYIYFFLVEDSNIHSYRHEKPKSHIPADISLRNQYGEKLRCHIPEGSDTHSSAAKNALYNSAIQ